MTTYVRDPRCPQAPHPVRPAPVCDPCGRDIAIDGDGSPVPITGMDYPDDVRCWVCVYGDACFVCGGAS